MRWSRTYAAETVTTSVCANLLSPGPIRTRMRATAMPGEDPETLPPPEAVARALLPLLDPAERSTGKIFQFRNGRIEALP